MALIDHDLFEGTIDKVAIAIDRIKAFEPREGYYVAFSGGKDSVVILDLVKRSGVKYDVHYNLTTVDPPELVRFIKTFPEVEIHRPEKNMWELIVEKGFPPTRMIRYCCKRLKEHGGHDRIVVTGVRWQESARRSKRKMNEVCFNDSRKFFLHAIIDWTDKEVWAYIKENNIPYCSLYDEGFRRLGCILCPMNTQRVDELKRWPKYGDAYKRAFARAIELHPYRKPGSAQTAEEMYQRWIDDSYWKKDNLDQTVMFE